MLEKILELHHRIETHYERSPSLRALMPDVGKLLKQIRKEELEIKKQARRNA